MKFKKALVYILSMTSFLIAFSQDTDDQHVEESYETLTAEWLKLSNEIKSYSGLHQFCDSEDYRFEILAVLSKIHHFDSLVLDIINDPLYQIEVDPSEYKQTMKELDKLATEYSVKSFVGFLKGSCSTLRDLEKDKKNLEKQSGMYSYDGQVLILETELIKYLRHLDKKIVSMEDHIHKIHPDQIQNIINLVSSD